jgi:hypothetical protein
MDIEKKDSACCLCLESTEAGGKPLLYSSDCCGCWLHLECAYSISKSSTGGRKCPLCRAQVSLPCAPTTVRKRSLELAVDGEPDIQRETVTRMKTLTTSMRQSILQSQSLRVTDEPGTVTDVRATSASETKCPPDLHTWQPEAPPRLRSPLNSMATLAPVVFNGVSYHDWTAAGPLPLTLSALMNRPLDPLHYFTGGPDGRFSHDGHPDFRPPSFSALWPPPSCGHRNDHQLVPNPAMFNPQQSSSGKSAAEDVEFLLSGLEN